MIKNILKKYYNLKLQQRVIIAINITLVVSLALISVLATVNRQNTQYKNAKQSLFKELDYLVTILNITDDKDIEDIKDVFYEKVFYINGHASLIHKTGKVLIGKKIEGQNVSSADYFREMNEKIRGSLTYTDLNEDKSSRQKKHMYFTYYEPLDSFITATVYHKDLITNPVLNTVKILLFALVFTLIVFSLVNYYVIGGITKPIKGLMIRVKKLAKGQLPETYEYNKENEVGQMVYSFNELVDGIKRTAVFASEIGKNNFDHEFTPLSEDDVLGNALLEMRQSLKKAAEEEQERKQEDKKRNWTTQGLAKFADILRQNTNDIEELSYNIVSNLVEYLNINQGGIFILNDEDKNEKFLELTACFAFDRRKFLDKKVKSGEGLVGTCLLEGQTIYLTDIPQNYIKITSGLGDENPSALLIVPLKVNDQILGVLELASFNKFEDYQIEFIEKIGESIASTISNVKINNNTAVLLEKSQQQAEEMRAQEEEMRQNMEELSATQEAMSEKDRENQLAISHLTEENEKLQNQIAEKENLIKELQEKLDDGKNRDIASSNEPENEAENTEIEEQSSEEDAKVDDAESDKDEDESGKDDNEEKNDQDTDDLLSGNTEDQKAWEKHLNKTGKKFKKGKKK